MTHRQDGERKWSGLFGSKGKVLEMASMKVYGLFAYARQRLGSRVDGSSGLWRTSGGAEWWGGMIG